MINYESEEGPHLPDANFLFTHSIICFCLEIRESEKLERKMGEWVWGPSLEKKSRVEKYTKK